MYKYINKQSYDFIFSTECLNPLILCATSCDVHFKSFELLLYWNLNSLKLPKIVIYFGLFSKLICGVPIRMLIKSFFSSYIFLLNLRFDADNDDSIAYDKWMSKWMSMSAVKNMLFFFAFFAPCGNFCPHMKYPIRIKMIGSIQK